MNIRCEFKFTRRPGISANVPSVITDVGDVPYDVARPILMKVESAAQLVKTPTTSLPSVQIITRCHIETDRRSIAADLRI